MGEDRRAWMRVGALGLLGAATLAAATGCGFVLRTTTLPFQRIAFRGFTERSSVARALAEAMGPTVALVPAVEQAELVLVALEESRGSTVVAFSATRRVNELRLELRFRFQTLGRDGRELLAPAELRMFRDMSFSETLAQGKAFEEQRLYDEMSADLARQIVRRLAAIPLDEMSRADLTRPADAA